jgi:hypothetical protein
MNNIMKLADAYAGEILRATGYSAASIDAGFRAALLAEVERVTAALQERDAEIACAKDSLNFVERWAVHHANKPGISAESALGCIAHYPPIKAITKSYVDGVPSHLPDPFEQIDAQRKALEQAVQVLLDIERFVDLRSRWRDADEKRMDVVVEEAITAIQELK